MLVDGAATYVQFHVTGSAGQGRYPLPLLLPTLSDDRGALVNEGTMGSVDPPGGSLPLPSWIPWRLPVVRRGYAILLTAFRMEQRLAVCQNGSLMI